ncbi:hypothetical protein CTZ27_33900 [Streptomyces griseocarneus]|nr:hypothetical protein CTZ27_33900 [Streptomyces griseocarneus]
MSRRAADLVRERAVAGTGLAGGAERRQEGPSARLVEELRGAVEQERYLGLSPVHVFGAAALQLRVRAGLGTVLADGEDGDGGAASTLVASVIISSVNSASSIEPESAIA